jgi:hypothetical protein
MRLVVDAGAEDPELAEDFVVSVHSSLQQQSFLTVEETGPDGRAPAEAARLKAHLVALDHRKGKRPSFLLAGRVETIGEATVAYELVGPAGARLWSETVETEYLVWSKPQPLDFGTIARAVAAGLAAGAAGAAVGGSEGAQIGASTAASQRVMREAEDLGPASTGPAPASKRVSHDTMLVMRTGPAKKGALRRNMAVLVERLHALGVANGPNAPAHGVTGGDAAPTDDTDRDGKDAS